LQQCFSYTYATRIAMLHVPIKHRWNIDTTIHCTVGSVNNCIIKMSSAYWVIINIISVTLLVTTNLQRLQPVRVHYTAFLFRHKLNWSKTKKRKIVIKIVFRMQLFIVEFKYNNTMTYSTTTVQQSSTHLSTFLIYIYTMCKS